MCGEWIKIVVPDSELSANTLGIFLKQAKNIQDCTSTTLCYCWHGTTTRSNNKLGSTWILLLMQCWQKLPTSEVESRGRHWEMCLCCTSSNHTNQKRWWWEYQKIGIAFFLYSDKEGGLLSLLRQNFLTTLVHKGRHLEKCKYTLQGIPTVHAVLYMHNSIWYNV